MVRIGWVGVLGALVVACGVPSVDDARVRTPGSGARQTFVQPYADVYRAGKTALELVQQTPDWKELQIRVDDPDGGVLIGERRLEGVVPGVRVRDLWSLYFTRTAEDATQVTFVLESSDQPHATVTARSWAKGQESIFPVMREILAAAEPRTARREPMPAPTLDAGRTGAKPAAQPAVEPPTVPAVVPSPARRAAPVASSPPASPATVLDRAAAALRAAADWRIATHEATIAGERVIAIGDWAQLRARASRCQVAFADDPAPPAYDVARLMRFLADHDIPVDVEPSSGFRRR
jgi:hypothetical protein